MTAGSTSTAGSGWSSTARSRPPWPLGPGGHAVLPELHARALSPHRRVHRRAGRGPTFVEGGSIWEVPCQVALPSATQNELGAAGAAALVRNGCTAVGEGWMPTTPDAVRVLQEAGVAFGPGKAANAGGVAASALEMQQNASRDSWTFEHSETRLRNIMIGIHARCDQTAEEYGAPGNNVAGANIAGYARVAESMLALGLI